MMCADCYNRMNSEGNNILMEKGNILAGANSLSKYKCSEVRDMVDSRSSYSSSSSFQRTRTVNGFMDIDDDNRMIYIPGGLSFLGKPNGSSPQFVEFDKIYEAEIIQVGGVVTNTGLLGGVVGGALFGGAGLAVGMIATKKTSSKVKNVSVSVISRDPGNPRFEIPLLNVETNKNNILYTNAMENARDIMAVLTQIIRKRM